MKFEAKQKYINISLCAFFVVAASIILFLILKNISIFGNFFRNIVKIISPFVWGFAIAYVLNYPYRGIRNSLLDLRLKKPLNKKFVKAFSLIVTYVLFLLFVGFFFYFLVPQLINALIGFVDVIPVYVTKIRVGAFDFIINYLKQFDLSVDDIYNAMNNVFEDFSKNFSIQNFMLKAVNFIISLSVGLKNFIIGIIISVYFLIDKERYKNAAKKLIKVVFNKNTARRVLYVFDLTDRTFGSFVVANVCDSAIIGVICYVGMSILKLDYALLISVMVGITNIIPFFGPFIGAVPSALLLFLVKPVQCLIFVIFIIILQQFDGNILKPKIFGESLGISAVFVIFAVLIGGGLFGIVGMFVGVPVFAVIYALLNALINKKYAEKISTGDKNEF